jgi:hypothetical protein
LRVLCSGILIIRCTLSKWFSYSFGERALFVSKASRFTLFVGKAARWASFAALRRALVLRPA